MVSREKPWHGWDTVGFNIMAFFTGRDADFPLQDACFFFTRVQMTATYNPYRHSSGVKKKKSETISSQRAKRS